MIGVDPDNSGAVTIIKLHAPEGGIRKALQNAEVVVHDMPCALISVGKRFRRSVVHTQRCAAIDLEQTSDCKVICRQADTAAIVSIVQEALHHSSPANTHCVLEQPVPGPANGKQSVFGAGFAFGVWNGVLRSHAAFLYTVSARRWKNDLSLNGCGKEGSRTLAAALFPKAEGLLR